MKKYLKFVLVTSVSILIAGNCQSQESRVNTAVGVIESMFNMYKGKWYSTLTFTQQTSFYKSGILDHEQTWYEAMSIPGGLVIKFDEIGSGNGILFKSDSQYVFKDNLLVNKTRKVHELLVLGFSVYVDTPEITIAKLKEAGFSFEFFTKEINNDSVEFVVGDPTVAQFWIDAKTLLFTRLRKKNKDGSFSEVHFNKYQKLGSAWIETEVLFFRNGQIAMKEVYNDIKTPNKLPDNLLSLDNFKSIKW